jgi:hypothetical protein
MAILKGSLEEEILTKSQRVIVKAIYKMSQLNEAKTTMSKIAYLSDIHSNECSKENLVPECIEKANLIKEYFDSEIEKILHSIKLPSRGLKKD